MAEEANSRVTVPSTLKMITICPLFSSLIWLVLGLPLCLGLLDKCLFKLGEAVMQRLPAVRVSHLLKSIPKAFRSRLEISLCRSCGLPLGQFPCTNSPYRRSSGIQPSAILTTCPSQHRHHCFSNVQYTCCLLYTSPSPRD